MNVRTQRWLWGSGLASAILSGCLPLQVRSVAPSEPDVSLPSLLPGEEPAPSRNQYLPAPGQQGVSARAADHAPLAPSPGPIAVTADALPAQLTLEQAVDETLRRDPTLRASWEKIRQAQADLVGASLCPNPQIETDIQMLPFFRPFTVDAQGGPPQYDLNIGYPLDPFIFGKRRAAIIEAGLGVSVADAQFQEEIRQQVIATIEAFLTVLETQAYLQIAQADLENLRQVEDGIRKRVELGGAGTIELDRIQLAVLDSLRNVRLQERSLEQAKTALQEVMGRSQLRADFSALGSLNVRQPLSPPDLAKILDDALQHRPDLIAAHRAVAQARANVQVEQTKAYPEFVLQTGYTHQFQRKAIGQPDADSMNFQLNTALPCCDRNQGGILKAKAQLAQSQAELQALMVKIRSEVDQALTEYRTFYEIVTKDDRRQLEAARNVRDKIVAAYRAGGRTLVEVIDAQRAFRDTYKLFISGEVGYWRALYRLTTAAGTTTTMP